jgi:deoxyhypusine synthase
MSRYREIDLTRQKRYKAEERLSKVESSAFAKTGELKLAEFWKQVPNLLKAAEMKELLDTCEAAFRQGKPIIIGMGGHVIKCGLAPLIIEMMRLGAVKALAVNGSVIIHDYEIARWGKTSEDVSAALEDGSFGMASDTADGINNIIKDGNSAGLGLGEAVGKALSETAPHKDLSLLAMAYQYNVPVTAHIAIGTDIIHQHASADGASIGEASLRDFRILCECLKDLNSGGVFLNFGSGVIIPEVFLKGISVVRNLGNPLQDFTTAVFDMNLQYRPYVNVKQRPVQSNGKGFYFIGYHEIMIPLFLLSLQERITQ